MAEKVLDEVARSWKKSGGGVIVTCDGSSSDAREGDRLKGILKTLEGCMIGGRIAPGKAAGTFAVSRQASFTFGGSDAKAGPDVTGAGGASAVAAARMPPSLGQRQDSFGLSGLDIGDEGDEGLRDPREWLKVIGGLEQPQMIYNTGRKHFERYGKYL